MLDIVISYILKKLNMMNLAAGRSTLSASYGYIGVKLALQLVHHIVKRPHLITCTTYIFMSPLIYNQTNNATFFPTS